MARSTDKQSPVRTRILGEHLNLTVAAHLARTQLVADPLARYDGDHLLEMVNAVAQALTRVGRSTCATATAPSRAS